VIDNMMKEIEKTIAVIVTNFAAIGLSFTDWVEWGLKILVLVATLAYTVIGIRQRLKKKHDENN
jgi:uncharacterized ion transporter superfamily protein YfcC